MRHLVYGILAGLLLATPLAAQPASNDNKTASAQGQATKDGKSAAQTTKAGQGDPATPAPAPQEVKEDPMANFNILGNAVGDGLGVPR
jgi:hypothetical protein